MGEKVKKGVGTNPKVVNEWVKEVWEMYVGEADEEMSGKEFERFIKSSFKYCKANFTF